MEGKTKLQPKDWVPDSEVTSCTECQAAFTLFNRRHHCRHCGSIFCNNCSRWRTRVPSYSTHKAHRVCKECYSALASQRQELLARRISNQRRAEELTHDKFWDEDARSYAKLLNTCSGCWRRRSGPTQPNPACACQRSVVIVASWSFVAIVGCFILVTLAIVLTRLGRETVGLRGSMELQYELEEVETLIRDFRSLIPSSQAPDYYEGPLSTEYKAIRAAMISHDKARFWEAIDDMRLTLNQELAQKLNCNEEVRRDLQTRSNLLSTRKDSSGGIQTSTSIISSGL